MRRLMLVVALSVLMFRPIFSGESVQPLVAPTASNDAAPAPRAGAPMGLTGQARFGESGAIRIAVTLGSTPSAAEGLKVSSSKVALVLEFINEGDEPFVFQPGDRCWAATSDGERFELVRESVQIIDADGESLSGAGTVQPGRTVTVFFSAPERKGTAPVVALAYASGQAGREIEVRDFFSPPSRRLTIAPKFPPEVTPTSDSQKVRLRVRIDSDGRVTEAFVLSPTPTRQQSQLAMAAATAVLQWVYEPALVNGTPTPMQTEVDISFGGRAVLSASYAVSLDVLSTRLAQFLKESFPVVLPLPNLGGFVAVEAPRRDQDGSHVGLFVVLYGKDAAADRSRIVVAARGSRGLSGKHKCACTSPETLPDAPRDLVERFTSSMQTSPTEVVWLVPEGGRIVPSGTLEPVTAGLFEGEVALRTLLRAQLLGKPISADEIRAALDSGEGNARGPATAGGAPGPAQGAIPLALEMEPPRRIKKVDPRYPENARRARISGKVLIEAVITRDGDVADVRVLHGPPELAPAAVAAVCCWKYEPAKSHGKPVEIYFTVVVDFSLE